MRPVVLLLVVAAPVALRAGAPAAPAPDSLLAAADVAGDDAAALALLADAVPRAGRSAWRWSARRGGGTARLSLAGEGDRWRLRGRWRRDVTGDSPPAGDLRVVPLPGLTVRWGRVAAAHGAGLVAGRPDRSPVLDAEHPLLGFRSATRLVPPGWRDGVAPGLALGVVVGDWRGSLVNGAAARSRHAPPPRLLRVARRCGRREELSLLVGASPGGRPFSSLALNTGGHPCRLAVEAARDGRSGAPPARAARVVVGGRWGSVELATAAAPPGWRAPAAGRVPLLPGGAGRGWAWRGVVRSAGWRAALLWAAGEEPPAATTGTSRRWRRLSLAWRRHAGDSRWGARLRWNRSHRWAVGTAPAVATAEAARLAVWWDGSAAGRPAAAAWQATARTADGGALQTRQVVWWRVQGAAPGGGRWRLRWTRSWGDPLDLTTVAVPLPGRLFPRHWGGWREELLLGAWWRRRGIAVGGFVARRLPAAGGAAAWRLELSLASDGRFL